jgi:hypothetical protein
VDAVPPPSNPPSIQQPAEIPYVYAATDSRPRGDREIALCRKASHPDWIYWGIMLAADVGSVYLDLRTKNIDPVGVRYLGPVSLGLSWGFTVGGAYLASPQCSPDWVDAPPLEGDVRPKWPFALSMALLGGATAPLFLGIIELNGLQVQAVGERSMRYIVAGGLGFGGALIPYLLPPKTWRAARELEKLRIGTTPEMQGAFVSYSARF